MASNMAAGLACMLAVFLAVLTITVLGRIQLPMGRSSWIYSDGYDTGLETWTTEMGHINRTTMESMETGYKMRRQRSQRRDEDDEYEGTRDEDDKQRNIEGQTTHNEDDDNEIDEIDGDL